MKALIIIGIILLLIIILLNIPVKVEFSYKDSTKLYLKYLFLKLDLLKETEKKDDDDKEEKPKKKRKMTYDLLIILTNNIIDAVPKLTKKLLKLLSKVTVDNTHLYVLVSGDNAHDTSTKFNKLSASIFAVYAILDNIFKVKKVHIKIDPDYNLEGWDFNMSTVFKVRPASLIVSGVSIFAVLLKTYVTIKREQRNLMEYWSSIDNPTNKNTVGHKSENLNTV